MDKAYKITIREMIPEDAGAVAAVEELCFAIPWSRQSFWQEVSNENTLYLVAVDEVLAPGSIVGYIGAWLIAGEAQITNIAVSPTYRRRKIGYRLFGDFVARIKERGITAVTLEVRPSNLAALNLYAKFGLKSVGRRKGYYADNGEDALIMWNTHL